MVQRGNSRSIVVLSVVLYGVCVCVCVCHIGCMSHKMHTNTKYTRIRINTSHAKRNSHSIQLATTNVILPSKDPHSLCACVWCECIIFYPVHNDSQWPDFHCICRYYITYIISMGLCRLSSFSFGSITDDMHLYSRTSIIRRLIAWYTLWLLKYVHFVLQAQNLLSIALFIIISHKHKNENISHDENYGAAWSQTNGYHHHFTYSSDARTFEPVRQRSTVNSTYERDFVIRPIKCISPSVY